MAQNIQYKSEQQKLNTLTRQVEQLSEHNRILRADNTTLRKKNTEIDAENFQLRIAYDELEDMYLTNLKNFHILQNSLTRE